MYDCATSKLNDATMPCVVPDGMARNSYVYLYEDFLQSNPTYAADPANIIKSFTLPSGSQGYKVRTLAGQTMRSVAGAEGDDGMTNYVPTITVQVPNTPADTEVVAGLASNELVVITEQKAKSTNNIAAFEIQGLGGGLKATAPVIEEGKNFWSLPLTNLASSPEKAPHSFFTTDEATDTYTADKAYLEATLTPAS